MKILLFSHEFPPMLGGAGSFDHFTELFNHVGLVGAGAGSFFVFKGKYRAVLISYPSCNKKKSLFPNSTQKANE